MELVSERHGGIRLQRRPKRVDGCGEKEDIKFYCI